MKTHTSSFKEQIKLIGKEIDSRITFGDTVLGKDDLNAVTPSYQGAILKSVMKQLDIDSNVAIPIGTILKYEFGLKVNGEYEYINYGNYVVYSIEKQEDTNSYKIVCYDKLLYSMLDYVKLPITYPISIRDYINAISTALGLKFANKSGTFANYNKQIQADLYDGLGYTFRDILDELAQVTASTICLNNNDELEIRYITETNDVIDEEYLKDVNVNFGERFGAVNTIVLSRSADSDSVYYPSVLPTNPYEIKISDNQIMNGNDRADFLPDIYNKLNGLEFYTNDFVSTGIIYYDLCDRYSVKVGDNTYSCVMFNDEVLVTRGLEENVYTELPEQTETDYKHASKDDRMINQVYIIAKKNEAEILALVSTTETIQKEINPTKDESGSEIIIEDASDNPLINLEIEGKSEQATRSGKNLFNKNKAMEHQYIANGTEVSNRYSLNSNEDIIISYSNYTHGRSFFNKMTLEAGTYTLSFITSTSGENKQIMLSVRNMETLVDIFSPTNLTIVDGTKYSIQFILSATTTIGISINPYIEETGTLTLEDIQLELGDIATDYEPYGVSPSPDYPSEIESVGYENLWDEQWETGTLNANTGNNVSITTRIRSKNFIDVNPNETYYLIIPSTAGNCLIVYYDNTKKYISSSYAYVNNYIFTTPSNCKYIKISPDTSYGGTYKNDIAIFKGKIARSYIPYGKYGIEVETVGKNLFDKSTIQDNTAIQFANGSYVTDNSYLSSDYIEVKPNTNYYCNYTIFGSSYYGLAFYDSNKSYLSGNKITNLITTPSNAKYLRFCVRKVTPNETNIDTLQLERGSVATEYSPYQKRTTVIVLNEPLRSLPNGTKDIAYIKNNILYVDRKVGTVVLNGTESWGIGSTTYNGLHFFTTNRITDFKKENAGYAIVNFYSNYFHSVSSSSSANLGGAYFINSLFLVFMNFTTVQDFRTWLSTHNTQVDYELAEPYTEELGEIEMPSTYKGINNITTTDSLLPIINLTYVRDTILADYVENHVAELKLTENEIKASVESVSSSVDGLNTSINRVEEITNDNSQVINVISTNIDKTSGEVREVTTTTGFTFNADGMTIDNGSGFKAEHRANGTYYKDGTSIVGQYTKDGSKQKDLELFGTYSYGKKSIDDTPMFIGQLYEDENGEECFGHFVNI